MLKLIYLAGPYSTGSILEIADHICQGRDMAIELMERGYAPYCPWLDWELAVRKHRLTVEHFKQCGLTILAKCDAMLLLPGWEDSRGTREEIAFARMLNIPVFTTIDAIDQWVELEASMNPPQPVTFLYDCPNCEWYGFDPETIVADKHIQPFPVCPRCGASVRR